MSESREEREKVVAEQIDAVKKKLEPLEKEREKLNEVFQDAQGAHQKWVEKQKHYCNFDRRFSKYFKVDLDTLTVKNFDIRDRHF